MKETDPRVKRTRRLILDALGQLLSEKNFQAITVQHIAERATVNRATFYAHFVDKYAALDSLVEEGVQQALNAHVQRNAPFSAKNLHTLTTAVMDFLGEFHDHCGRDKGVSPVMELKVQQKVHEYLLGWLGDDPGETTIAAVSWAIFGAAVEWSRGSRQGSPDQRAAQLVDLITEGLNKAAQLPYEPAAVPHSSMV